VKSLVALVGTKYRGKEMLDLLASLPSGEPLFLRRDPDNEYDPNAVQVWARGHHIGFIPKSQNGPIAAAMDKMAAGRVNVRSLEMPAKLAIDGGQQPMIELEE
jgi:hypothetical protein